MNFDVLRFLIWGWGTDIFSMYNKQERIFLCVCVCERQQDNHLKSKSEK